MYWLDYSAAKLSGATIKTASDREKAAGRDSYGGVIRYIDAPDRLRTKHTNVAEYQDHVRSGLQVRLVMEVATGDANGGYAQGVAYARRALAGANMLGYGGVIYFCNDTPTLASSTLWDDYLTGAASVLGWDRIGAYGFANAMDVASHMTDCRHFWQAGRRSDVRPFVQIWQDNNTQVTVGGITCDRNLILKDLEKEDDMPLSDSDVDRVAKAVWERQLQNLNPQPGQPETLPAGILQYGTNMGAWEAVARLVALANDLTDDEVKILAAIRAQPTGQVDVDALAVRLAPLIPTGATPEQVQEAVRRVFARAGQEGASS